MILKSLSMNPPGCPSLCNDVFDNLILAGEPFAKALSSFKTCVLVNNNLWEKSFSSLESPTTFDEIFKVTLPFFIPNFNLLITCELESFTFKVSFYLDIKLEQT